MNRPSSIKLTPDTSSQFEELRSSMCSLPTLSLPKMFPSPLKTAGINERDQIRNSLVGAVVTRPSVNELAIEAVFFDKKDRQDNGDLYVVNFLKGIIDCYYRGQWGEYINIYGKQHRRYKGYLRKKTQFLKRSDSKQ